MQFSLVASILAGLSLVKASPLAEALPWANANPQANAAAQAFADAYAEAQAIGHPDPEAYAYAASADDCATIACHAACGLLIIEGTSCSENSDNTYKGPYNTTCLCSSGSAFLSHYDSCMTCGWTLWKYYGVYVSSALAACSTLSTEPTGTERCSTTLSASYTADYGIQGCSYLGNCSSSSSKKAEATSSTADETTSSSAAAETTSSSAAAETTSSSAAAETTSTEAGSSAAETTSTEAGASSEAGSSAAAETTSTEAGASSEAAETTSSKAAASSEAAAESTSVSAQTSSGSEASSTVAVSTYEGAAVKVGGAATALVAVVLSFLI